MALTLATELANYAAGIGTQGATLKIDSANKRVGVGTTNPQGPEGSLQVGTGITFFGNTGIISAIGGKFSGDFTVGGTLTYEDVQNVNSSGVGTFSGGINIVGGGLTVTGVSTFFSALDVNSTADFAGPISVGDTISLGDHDKIRFGDGNDLEIYHDGSNSYIRSINRTIYIDQTADNFDIVMRNDDGSGGLSNYIQLDGSQGSVILSHYGNTKLETTSSGINVTGITTATELDIKDSSSNEPSLKLSTGTATNFFSISRSSSTGHYTFASEENGSRIIFSTDPDGNGAQERLTIDRYGHVGINTVPSSWESGADTSVLQIDGASVACINDTDFFATSNAYWDGSNWKRIQTGEAVSYYQHNDDRKHVFRSAASGSPGSNVSWSNQLVIDVAGNVNITGITTANQLFEGSSRVATAGKAVAMALVFG